MRIVMSAILIAVPIFLCLAGHGEPLDVVSPDGNLKITVGKDATHNPVWSVEWNGRDILLSSELGLVLSDGTHLGAGFEVAETHTVNQDATWQPVYGERSEIRDNYNELSVTLDGKGAIELILRFRAYNEGAAVCYELPEQDTLEEFTIKKELTQFRFAGNHRCYPVYSAQGVYQSTTLDKIKPGCERPLTIVVDDSAYAAVAEARLVNYARMRLQPVKGVPYAVAADLSGDVSADTPYTTPWRVLMVGESPGELIERNYIILNLNAPCAIEDTSWIKPGKVIREVTLTTEGGKACVDFAVEQGLQYIEYDAGWYGPENEVSSDATTVTRDTNKSGVKGDLDLHEVIGYAAERGIGVLVYVNRRQLERQLDEILPLYQEWGIKGVKYGFVRVGDQQWTTWLHDAVRKAAEHRLMVDVHDEYRPTGVSRTYPNLMTQEGIRGNETMPPPEHNLILPFTRGLCGAGDYTICWYTDRIKTSHAHQLAASVVFYSPLQFLYWYDRPSQHKGEPETEFFKHLPTVWDETRVTQGEIGRFITIARRKGDEWYVGTMNAGKRRRLTIALDFLDPETSYRAFVYSDDEAAQSGDKPTAVDCDVRSVAAGDTLVANCTPNGGQAIRLTPVDKMGVGSPFLSEKKSHFSSIQ